MKDNFISTLRASIYAQINSLDGVVTCFNAGHNPPFVLRASGQEPELLARTGMALGVDPSAVFTQRTVTLEAGDFILFYTDGVPDALNDARHEFGEKRLRELALAHQGDSAIGMQSKRRSKRILEKRHPSMTSL